MSLFLITTPRNKQVFIQESELFMWLNDRFTVYPFDHHSLFEDITEMDVSRERKLYSHTFRKVGGVQLDKGLSQMRKDLGIIDKTLESSPEEVCKEEQLFIKVLLKRRNELRQSIFFFSVF